MVGIQTQSHIEMDSAARNTDDEGDVLAKVRVKPAGSQKEETNKSMSSKHEIYSNHSCNTNWVYEINKDRRPVCEQPRFSEKTRSINFHKQVHHEYKDIDNNYVR